MFYCKLCEKETVYVSSFCENTCRPIKNIMNVYGPKEVLDILQKVCIRDETKRQYKINDLKTQDDTYEKKSIELRNGKKC